MPGFWTIAQGEANADRNAQEFANRQILLRGTGTPDMPAPLGSEYEDESTVPPTRYRKTGAGPADWLLVSIIETASQQEVANGVNTTKMVTPATLSGKLDEFALQVLGILPAQPTTQTGLVEVNASTSDAGAAFDITLPDDVQEPVLSVVITGYGANASLSNIMGGAVGQVVSLRRDETGGLTINSTDNIKISGVMLMDDSNQLDNLTLQRISDTVWVEVARKLFT